MRNLIHLALLAALVCLAGCPAGAQTTSITATITDSDSITWVDGSCSIAAIYKPQGVPPYLNSGGNVPLTPSCTVSGSGALSATVTDVHFIAPVFQLTWQFTVCPNVSQGVSPSACGVTQIAATGGSEDLTGLLNLPPPRIGGGIGSFAYADIEVAPLFNNVYWNVVDQICRQYSTAWFNCDTSAGGGPPSGPAGGSLSGTYPNPTLFNLGSVSSGDIATRIGIGVYDEDGAAVAAQSAAEAFAANGSNISSGTVAAARVATLNQNTTGTAGGLAGSPAITVSSVTDSGLTAGNCVQAFTGGLLQTTGTPCGTSGASGFPITLGSTSVGSGSTHTTLDGLTLTGSSVNGVTPSASGAATNFLNQAGAYTVPAGTGVHVICSGTQSLGSPSIASGTKTNIAITCTGAATTDNPEVNFNGGTDPSTITGFLPSTAGTLSILKWPAANVINVTIENNTANTINMGSTVVNYRLTR